MNLIEKSPQILDESNCEGLLEFIERFDVREFTKGRTRAELGDVGGDIPDVGDGDDAGEAGSSEALSWQRSWLHDDGEDSEPVLRLEDLAMEGEIVVGGSPAITSNLSEQTQPSLQTFEDSPAKTAAEIEAEMDAQ